MGGVRLAPQLCPLLVVRLLTSHFSSLTLIFLFCKLQLVIDFPLYHCERSGRRRSLDSIKPGLNAKKRPQTSSQPQQATQWPVCKGEAEPCVDAHEIVPDRSRGRGEGQSCPVWALGEASGKLTELGSGTTEEMRDPRAAFWNQRHHFRHLPAPPLLRQAQC